MAALNYETIKRWMEFAVWAKGEYNLWFPLDNEEECLHFLKYLAQEALSRRFSLRVQNRIYGVYGLLEVLAPGNQTLLDTWLKHEDWLTPKPQQRKDDDSLYY